ncbi:hypothetical protein [Euzebya sp.]|uniref:hypothetical protein n=1 Tax=Euzebya sp. TaxID=1971409 RepID=UPI0035157BB8
MTTSRSTRVAISLIGLMVMAVLGHLVLWAGSALADGSDDPATSAAVAVMGEHEQPASASAADAHDGHAFMWGCSAMFAVLALHVALIISTRSSVGDGDEGVVAPPQRQGDLRSDVSSAMPAGPPVGVGVVLRV